MISENGLIANGFERQEEDWFFDLNDDFSLMVSPSRSGDTWDCFLIAHRSMVRTMYLRAESRIDGLMTLLSAIRAIWCGGEPPRANEDCMIYLASPYSHQDRGVREYRFKAACFAASKLMQQGHMVFSPIAHSHPISLFGLTTSWEFWEKYDRSFLGFCSKLFVLTIDGWKESVGVQAEIKIMKEMKKDIVYGTFGELPS